MKTPSQHGKHLGSNPEKKAKGQISDVVIIQNMGQEDTITYISHTKWKKVSIQQLNKQDSGRQIGQRITFRGNMLVGELLYLSALKFKFEQKKSSTFLNLFNFTLYSFEGKICVRFCILADCQIYANMLASNCVPIVNNYSNQSLKVIST